MSAKAELKQFLGLLCSSTPSFEAGFEAWESYSQKRAEWTEAIRRLMMRVDPLDAKELLFEYQSRLLGHVADVNGGVEVIRCQYSKNKEDLNRAKDSHRRLAQRIRPEQRISTMVRIG
ncbi:MAG: hypothetical protein VYA34_14410 [Myxococcota bacterium]|nr:hypothetical protein [Myxococcota bacterium]